MSSTRRGTSERTSIEANARTLPRRNEVELHSGAAIRRTHMTGHSESQISKGNCSCSGFVDLNDAISVCVHLIICPGVQAKAAIVDSVSRRSAANRRTRSQKFFDPQLEHQDMNATRNDLARLTAQRPEPLQIGA